MGTKVADSGGGVEFTPPPAGITRTVCVNYQDVGTHKSEWQGETKWQNQVMLVWEIDETYEADGKQVRFTIAKFYTKSLHEKANLRHDLVSWRGREFTEDELKGFDLDNILGKSCQLNIIHEQKNNKTRAKVTAVLPLGKGMEGLDPSIQPWRYDIGEDGYHFPEQMSDKMKARVGASREMSAANTLPGTPYGTQDEPIIEPEGMDDEIPF